MPKRTKCEATQYAEDVLSGKVPSGRLARLSCKRFIDDLKRDDIVFDRAAAERFYKFCTYMQHYKGPMSGQPLELEPWQKFIFANIYGWKRKDTGAWRFNYAYIEVPRKNGKALALDTPIPTPGGWKAMGDLNVGDSVIGDDGKPTKIVGAWDHNKPCYRVGFSNGDSVVACEDHLWSTRAKVNEAASILGTTTKSTKQICETLDSRHTIQMPKPEELPSQYRPHCKGLSVTITSCERVETVPTRCIQVDNESHLFLCGKTMIPTHNSTMCGAGALYDAGFFEPYGCEVYCAATKEDQAKIVVNDAISFVKQSEPLSEEFEFLSGKYSVFKRSSDRTSFVKPLGSDAKTLDGLNPFSVYCDELHEWRDRRLWDVLEDAFGARTNWHMISITTAGFDTQGICWDERKHLCAILEGTIQADNKFGIIHTVDGEPHEADWEDESQWYAANPNLGTGKQVDYMHNLCEKSKAQPSKLTAFLNKQLNIWTDAEEIWIPAHKWEKCGAEFDREELNGKYCYTGMDLARVHDLSAVAYFFPKQDGLVKARAFVDFFAPDENILERSKNDNVGYDTWERLGHLTATPGRTTDYDFIKASIDRNLQHYQNRKLSFDRHFAGELINTLEKEGVTCNPFGMGFLSLGSPTAELERMVMAEEIEHDCNPVLQWNVSNTVVRTDPAGNIKPDKEKAIEKIDGVVALITAIGGYLQDKEEEKVNVYEKKPMRVIDLTPDSKKRFPRIRV